MRPFWFLGVNKVWLHNLSKFANFYLIKIKWAGTEILRKKTCSNFIAYVLNSNLDKTYQVRYKFSFVFQLWLNSQIRNKEFIPCDAETREMWRSWKLKQLFFCFCSLSIEWQMTLIGEAPSIRFNDLLLKLLKYSTISHTVITLQHFSQEANFTCK